VVLSAIFVLLVPPFPNVASSAAEIVAYYPKYRGPFLVGNYLAALAVVPSLPLLAYLTRLVREAEGEGGAWWIMLLGSALLAHAVGTAVLMVYQAVAVVAIEGNAAVAKALSDLANMGFGFFFVVLMGYCVISGLAFVKTAVAPRWIGYAGIACGVLAFVASLGSLVTVPPLGAGGPTRWPRSARSSSGACSSASRCCETAWGRAPPVRARPRRRRNR
jgi:hypothetical protein